MWGSAASTASLGRAARHRGARAVTTSTRVAGIGNNVFAEISQLAARHGAVNLGQGFPSFHTPECVVLVCLVAGLVCFHSMSDHQLCGHLSRSFVKQAAIDAIHANHNQYTRPGGQLDYVRVLADMYTPLLERELDPMTNIVTFNGAQEGIASILAALLEPVRACWWIA